MSVYWDVSRDAIARLEPVFYSDVNALLSASDYEWHVMYAYRSLELQAQLYADYERGGSLAAPPGESAHNYGLAVDVQLWVPFHPDSPSSVAKRVEWNVKAPGWQWLFKAVLKSPRLHSGISFGDFDHIERYEWREHQGWAAGEVKNV